MLKRRIQGHITCDEGEPYRWNAYWLIGGGVVVIPPRPPCKPGKRLVSPAPARNSNTRSKESGVTNGVAGNPLGYRPPPARGSRHTGLPAHRSITTARSRVAMALTNNRRPEGGILLEASYGVSNTPIWRRGPTVIEPSKVYNGSCPY